MMSAQGCLCSYACWEALWAHAADADGVGDALRHSFCVGAVTVQRQHTDQLGAVDGHKPVVSRLAFRLVEAKVQRTVLLLRNRDHTCVSKRKHNHVMSSEPHVVKSAQTDLSLRCVWESIKAVMTYRPEASVGVIELR
jgi:hypothetical protein